MNIKKLLLLSVVTSSFLLAGCVSSTAQIINSESQSQLKVRSYQTKVYDNISKIKATRSTIAVLQDLGFVIDKADLLTGTVSGTKLDGYKLVMSITIRQAQKSVKVRANAQYGIKAIKDPKIYQDFFVSLDKGMFLEKNAL
ncbi:hypothetical protein [Candidatus Thiodubiliella endoseptemdiera]|uniref:hypothetical protein n=1 Tax=Candidatus Thiodubiliella endoseptemdiera TaxID=2738886 RepID=UPI0034DF67E5